MSYLLKELYSFVQEWAKIIIKFTVFKIWCPSSHKLNCTGEYLWQQAGVCGTDSNYGGSWSL